MNLIQLCELVDIKIINFSGFALLSDPFWKMLNHFSNFWSYLGKRATVGNPFSSKIVLIVVIWPYVQEKNHY